MSRFREELAIIPRTAWVIAALAYVGFSGLLWFLLQKDPNVQQWPLVGRIAVAFLPPVITAIFVLLIGYVYADAKRRRMRYILWTFLAIFIPEGLGIILYFILRDPMPHPCPHCGMMTGKGFAFCPSCGHALAPRCPNCGRGVETKWTHCAYCGTGLPAA